MNNAWEKICKKYIGTGRPSEVENYGTIQWKGTSVCMDVRCSCGEITHIDADFTYIIVCGKCKRKYWAVPYVSLLELDAEHSSLADKLDSCIVTTKVDED